MIRETELYFSNPLDALAGQERLKGEITEFKQYDKVVQFLQKIAPNVGGNLNEEDVNIMKEILNIILLKRPITQYEFFGISLAVLLAVIPIKSGDDYFKKYKNLSTKYNNTEIGKFYLEVNQIYNRLMDNSTKHRDQIFNHQNKELLDKKYDASKIEVLVIEQTQGHTLDDLHKRLNVEAWREIIFQILYTLEVFNRLGLRHNDLHPNNIFIEVLPAPKKNYYIIKANEMMEVESYFCVKIFDFDDSASHCQKGLLNPMYHGLVDQLQEKKTCFNSKSTGDRCRAFGICNDVNTKFDTYLILHFILGFFKVIDKKSNKVIVQSNEVTEFIKRNISHELLNVKWAEAPRMGYPANKGQERSYVPSSEEMKSTHTMFYDPFFNPFRVKHYSKQDCQNNAVYQLPLLVNESVEYVESTLQIPCFQSTITVSVATEAHGTLRFDIKLGDTIAYMKEKISDLYDIPVSKQRLTFLGQDLRMKSKIADIYLFDNDELHLVLQLIQ
jgi:hypothetical protein